MADSAIIGTVFVTIHTVFADAPCVCIRIFTNFYIFCVIVASSAVHGKDFFVFFRVTMVTLCAIQAVFIRVGMSEVVKYHSAAVGGEFHFFGSCGFFKTFRVVTEFAIDRTLDMAVDAVFADASFMNICIFTDLCVFLIIVVAFPAVHLLSKGVVGILLIIMVAFFAFHIVEGDMQLMIKNNAAAFGVECDPYGFVLFFERVADDCDNDKRSDYNIQK
jgi:hypothetical protein